MFPLCDPAAGSSALGARAGCRPTRRARSTSTRPRARSGARATCSTACTSPRAPIARAQPRDRGRGLHRRDHARASRGRRPPWPRWGRRSPTEQRARPAPPDRATCVLCFDADAAGAEAALRGMELAERRRPERARWRAARRATDPADLAARRRSAGLRGRLDAARGRARVPRRPRARRRRPRQRRRAHAARSTRSRRCSRARRPPSSARAGGRGDRAAAPAAGDRATSCTACGRASGTPRSRTRAGAPADDRARPGCTVERLLLALALADPAAGLPALTALDRGRISRSPSTAPCSAMLCGGCASDLTPREDAEIEREFGPELDALAAREPGGNDAFPSCWRSYSQARARDAGVQKQRRDADKSDDEWREFHRLQAAAKGARGPDVAAPGTPA